MCFLIPFRHLPTFHSPAHNFLMNFLISLKLMQASQALIPWGMLHGLLYHSAVFICRACHSFTSVWSFMSGTLELLYLQMRAQLVSGPMGPIGGWVTRKQWMLAEIPVYVLLCYSMDSYVILWSPVESYVILCSLMNAIIDENTRCVQGPLIQSKGTNSDTSLWW